jgi:hypothetical protein
MTISLPDHLRALPDQRLADLLRRRPDLVVPVPADLSVLAVRAQSRLSVARALDRLDRFTLEVLDALRLSREADGHTASVPGALALISAAEPAPPAAAVREAVTRLGDLALLYGPEDAPHVVGTIDEVCGPYLAGLGRPAGLLDATAAALCADPARLRRAVLAATPAARAVLDRLAAGPPVGTVAPGTGEEPADDGDSPVRWLVEQGLLVRTGPETVELPREVGLALRRRGGGGPLGALHPVPPTPAGRDRGAAAADSAGAGQALEAVRHTEALLEAVAADPPSVLRSGGVGVRDLRRLARACGLTEPVTALLLEVAQAAGLLGEADPDSGEPHFLPALPYDQWRTDGLAARWIRLASAWLAMTREPGLIGRRGDRDRLLAALSPDVERSLAPARRGAVLDVLAGVPAGTAVDADGVLEVLGWRSPRRFPPRQAGDSGTGSVLAEAATLGVTGLGALTSYGRLLLEESREAAADDDPLGTRDETPQPRARTALDALLPAPVDHLLLQADLTAVVPGPPEPGLAAALDLVAEPESGGGASVHRITSGSIRRALDAGYLPGELHDLFARRSRTPVPQALTYLIDDVARRHGGLRAGAAGAYLRSEDEGLLSELLADRRVVLLALRRLAPTVLVTPYSTGRLLGVLREYGYAPLAEDASGAALLARPKVRRAAARPTATALRRGGDDARWLNPALTPPRLAGVVEQIRRGDAAARAARRAPVTVRPADHATAAQAHMQALAVLQQAVREKRKVWVGYVDAHGGAASRLVRPVSIGAGYLRAEDERTETLHTFRLERITAAVPEA